MYLLQGISLWSTVVSNKVAIKSVCGKFRRQSKSCSNFPAAAATTSSTTSTMSMMTRTTTTRRKEMINYKFNINDNECRIVGSSIRSFRLPVLIYYICIILCVVSSCLGSYMFLIECTSMLYLYYLHYSCYFLSPTNHFYYRNLPVT